ncbi:hypothetical protein OAL55_05310, partial [Verrucomicrobiales bacterium]|nr:hypothetical protein [Verrucomicrobiales bacterium]
IRNAKAAGNEITITADLGAEAIGLAAIAAAAADSVKSISLADDSFRFENITSYRDPQFVPGAVKYGDLPGLIKTVTSLGAKVQVK